MILAWASPFNGRGHVIYIHVLLISLVRFVLFFELFK